MAFYLVPEKYDFIPSQSEIDTVQDVLRKMLGQIEIEFWNSEEVQVIGLLTTGTQEISCPACGSIESFENPAGFGEMLFVQSAETIEFEMPCCEGSVNLAQIDLTPNTKFSRFYFEINSDIELSSIQLGLVGHALGIRALVVAIDDE